MSFDVLTPWVSVVAGSASLIAGLIARIAYCRRHVLQPEPAPEALPSEKKGEKDPTREIGKLTNSPPGRAEAGESPWIQLAEWLQTETPSIEHMVFLSHAHYSDRPLSELVEHPLRKLRRQSPDLNAFRAEVLGQLLGEIADQRHRSRFRALHCDIPHIFYQGHRVRFSFQIPEERESRVWSHGFLTTNFDSLIESALQIQTRLSKPILWEFPVLPGSSIKGAIRVAFMIYGNELMRSMKLFADETLEEEEETRASAKEPNKALE